MSITFFVIYITLVYELDCSIRNAERYLFNLPIIGGKGGRGSHDQPESTSGLL
jgi:hypothetical protein